MLLYFAVLSIAYVLSSNSLSCLTSILNLFSNLLNVCFFVGFFLKYHLSLLSSNCPAST